MNDAYFSYSTLNSTRNVKKIHTLVVGYTNEFYIYSYLTQTLKKTNGNDVFIARIFDVNGQQIECLLS